MKVKVNPLNRKNWLSYYILLQKAKMLKSSESKLVYQYLVSKVKAGFGSLFFKFSPIWILFCFILFYFFPIDGTIYSLFPLPNLLINENFYNTLWQVHGSFVALAFVIIFFFFESLSSRISATYRSSESILRQEFYRTSWIQPILFLNLFSIGYIGFIINIESRSFQATTLFALGILSICLLFIKAFDFFSSDNLEKVRLRILNQEISNSIDSEVDRRLSENLLLNIHSTNNLIEYPAIMINEHNLTPITLNIKDRAVITDLDIDRIHNETIRIKKKFSINKTIGDIISSQYNIVGYIPKDSDNESISILQKCFKSTRARTRRTLDLILDDIAGDIVRTINTGNSIEFRRFLEIYYLSIEAFIQELNAYGIRYSSHQARTGDIFHEWEPLYRIEKDFYQIINTCIEKGNEETINDTIYFIGQMLELAIEYKEHLVYNRFIGFYVSIYLKILKHNGLKENITRILLSSLESIILTRLLLRMQYSKIDEDAEQYRDYIEEGLRTYEQFLKISLENGLVNELKQIGQSLDNICQSYAPRDTQPFIEEIEVELQNTALDLNKKEELTRQLEIKRKLIQIKDDVNRFTQEIWFGIGAWAVELYENNKMANDITSQFVEYSGSHFKTIKDLSTIFFSDTLSSGNVISGNHHAWNWWILDDKPSGVVIQTRINWLDRFYCLWGMKMTPLEIDNKEQINPSQNVKTSFDSIEGMTEKLLSNFNKWAVILGKDTHKHFLQKQTNFLDFHRKAIEVQKRIEINWLIEQPLNEEKIADFTKAVIHGWENHAVFRQVFEKLGNYELGETAEKLTFGIHEFVPKGIFIVGQYAETFVNLEIFGQRLGKGENQNIVSQMVEAIDGNRRIINKDSLVTELENSLNWIRNKGYNPSVILGNLKSIRLLEKDDSFVPKWKMKNRIDIPNLMGILGSIPVLFMREISQDIFFLIDCKKIGVFHQCKVGEGSKEIIDISVKSISPEDAKEMIKTNPKLLLDNNNEKRSIDDVFIELQQKVIVRIVEEFSLRVEDNNAGILLQIK